MTERRIITSVVFLFAVATPVMADETLVGTMGEPDRIEIVGNRAYSANQIRTGLSADLDVVVASRPDGDLATCLRTLQESILAGYQLWGYGKAKVIVRQDTERGIIIVEIDEEPRFHWGRIQINNAKALPVDRFLEKLSAVRDGRQQQEPGQDPIPPDMPAKWSSSVEPLWIKGEPAECNDRYWSNKHPQLLSIFQSMGYFAATFTCRVQLEQDLSATLIIDLDEEGPRSTLDKFEIVGLKENSVADVIRYLDIPLGTPLDLDVKRQIERKLWDSARFLKYFVEIVPPALGDEAPQTTVKITLSECDVVPLLSEELTAEQQAFLCFYRWLSLMSEAREDIQVTWDLPQDEVDHSVNPDLPDATLALKLNAIFSPQNKAVLLSAQITDRDRTLLDWSINMTSTELVFDTLPHGLRYRISGFDLSLVLNLEQKFRPDDDKPDSFFFGCGYHTRRNKELSPLQIRAILPPVLALRFYSMYLSDIHSKGNLLMIEANDELEVWFDSNSGALDHLAMPDGDGSIIKAICRPGLYRERLAKHEESMVKVKTVTPGDAPISSFAAFVVQSLDDSAGPVVSSLKRFGERVLQNGGFSGFDGVINRYLEYEKQTNFSTPYVPSSKLVRAHNGWVTWIEPLANALLPKIPVIRNLSHELVLAQAMRSYETTPAFEKAVSVEGIGPITYLISKQVFDLVGAEVPKTVVQQSITGATRESFQRDCDLYLNDDWVFGKLILALTAAIQNADDAEIDALVKLLSSDEESDEVVKGLLKMLSESKGKSPKAALLAVLDHAWEPFLQPGIRELLQQPLIDPEDMNTNTAVPVRDESKTHPASVAATDALDALIDRDEFRSAIKRNSKESVSDQDHARSEEEFAAVSLIELCPDAKGEVRDLLRGLNEKDIDGLQRGIHRIGRIGQDAQAAAPALMHLLKHQDGFVRNHAVLALARMAMSPPESVHIIVDGLKSNEPKIRSFAVAVLAEMGPQAAVVLGILAKSLKDRDPYVRLHAAEVLIRDDQWANPALETLLDSLRDKDEDIRWLATYSLAELAPETNETVDALIRATRDPVVKVQIGAVYALGEIGPFAKKSHRKTAEAGGRDDRGRVADRHSEFAARD